MPASELPVIAHVADALESMTVADLKELLAHLPTKPRATRKAEVIACILEGLQGEGLHDLWKQLDDLQQKAVAEAVHSVDSVFHGARFRAKYGGDPNWGTADRWGYNRVPSRLNLFLYGNGTLPQDLKERLKAFVPSPPPTALKTLEEPPATIDGTEWEYVAETNRYLKHSVPVPVETRQTEQAAIQELQATLRLVHTGKIALSDKTQLPTAASLKQVAGVLTGGDYYDATDADSDAEEGDQKVGAIRAFAWPLLLYAGGLAEFSGKKLALSKAGQRALAAPPAETLRALWRKWLRTDVLDELRRVNAIRGQTGKGKSYLTAPRNRRPVIEKALHDCPAERWVGIDDFLRYLRAANYDFEVTRDPWTLYISEANYGSLGYSGSLWPLLQGRFILCLLFEYAATLGMIDVAYVAPHGVRKDYADRWGADDLEFLSRYDGLLAFRLTQLGAYCLGLTDTYNAPRQEARKVLRVLPNREVVHTERPVPASDTIFLDLYAEKRSENVWSLNEARLLAALEAGYSLRELREWLESHSETALPETVVRLFDDILNKAERLKDRGVRKVIECGDPALLLLITHDSRTARLCTAAGERHLLVPLESEGAFRRAVRQLGYVLLPEENGKKT